MLSDDNVSRLADFFGTNNKYKNTMIMQIDLANNSAKNMKTIIIIYISILEYKNTFFMTLQFVTEPKNSIVALQTRNIKTLYTYSWLIYSFFKCYINIITLKTK